MIKKHAVLFAIFSFTWIALVAQTDSKYLKGAVPEENGKVVFSNTIELISNISDEELFEKVNLWAKKNYKGGKSANRILLSDSTKKQIGCSGKEDLVLGRKLLSLDIAIMSYQLILEIEQGACNAKIRGISYEYGTEKNNEHLLAEEMITDKVAINKNGDKLNNYYGRFRTVTIDSINSIFQSLQSYINNTISQPPQIQYIYIDKNTGEEVPSPVTNTISVATASSSTQVSAVTEIVQPNNAGAVLQGFKNIAPENIPGNIIKLLNDWALITSGKEDKVNVMTASWGGLGVFWDKPIYTCFINPSRYTITTMDEGETYTVSFYTAAYKDKLEYCGSTSGRDTDKIKGSGLTPIKTPSGATAFQEAWMIFECKKIIAQPISEACVKVDKSELSDNWSKNGFHKMYIGEILNVWIK